MITLVSAASNHIYHFAFECIAYTDSAISSILENPTGGSVITLKTQAGLYSKDDTEKLMGIYINLLQSFVGSARIRLDDPTMSTELGVEEIALHGQGMSACHCFDFWK